MKFLFLVFGFLPIVCFSENQNFEKNYEDIANQIIPKASNPKASNKDQNSTFEKFVETKIDRNEYLFNRGVQYYHGQGEFPKDYEQAFKWFYQAANLGHTQGQAMLGIMYYKGLGVSRDYKKAFQWFYKSAYQNNTKAQIMVGHMYFFGKGVFSKNYTQSYLWFSLAAFNEDEYAIGLIDTLRRYVPTSEMAQVQKLIHEKYLEILESQSSPTECNIQSNSES